MSDQHDDGLEELPPFFSDNVKKYLRMNSITSVPTTPYGYRRCVLFLFNSRVHLHSQASHLEMIADLVERHNGRAHIFALDLHLTHVDGIREAFLTEYDASATEREMLDSGELHAPVYIYLKENDVRKHISSADVCKGKLETFFNITASEESVLQTASSATNVEQNSGPYPPPQDFPPHSQGNDSASHSIHALLNSPSPETNDAVVDHLPATASSQQVESVLPFSLIYPGNAAPVHPLPSLSSITSFPNTVSVPHEDAPLGEERTGLGRKRKIVESESAQGDGLDMTSQKRRGPKKSRLSMKT